MVADQEVYDIGRLEACSWFVVNPGLFFESLRDWSRKTTSPYKPIKCKTDGALVAFIFRAYGAGLSSHWLHVLFSVVLIDPCDYLGFFFFTNYGKLNPERCK